MGQKIIKGIKDLLSEANKIVSTITVEKCKSIKKKDFEFADLRDYREIIKDGKIPGAYSCPRGMLEFWIDTDGLTIESFLTSIRPIFFINQVLGDQHWL